MKTKTIKLAGSIWAKKEKWHTEPQFVFYNCSIESEYLRSDGGIPIAPYEIEIEMPKDFDLYKSQLTALQNKRKLILAENEKRLNEIDEEIQNHMALEHHE